ncbi:MAG: ATP-dependent RNA helicase HrpA, partial [Acidimicrobiales bacterium]
MTSTTREAHRAELHRQLTETLRFPADLPISARRDDLVAAIAEHQVVVVAGETGSGKSTQLPKLCLAAGRGHDGLIGHTQPRRIAARTIAERVAAELDTELGGAVGYTVRFHDQVGDDTLVKVMTDGILLAEIQRDRLLSRYDTIIIDEAHERSLNIDFLLGYLYQLLPRRPDLTVIITSATIDTARFAEHFDDAPVIEVSGRTHPVEIRYEPPEDPDTGVALDQSEAIVEAVRSLQREGPGDVLVFCSGEREIRDAAGALRDLHLPDTEILPLYARLSSAEQHRVFQAHRGRRVVLATNVAETSLTVPGIRYVVDPGTARISRYSYRTKVQRLPIEAVSQASADQRAGRCGRLGPGICIRLYSEDDYLARPRFTEPEVQRTNLASVILKMASLGLGAVEDFGFIDPPDERAIRDGILLLEELGAVDPDQAGTRRWLTPVGRSLAELPVDPRLGRMILEGAATDCLHEVLVITAALSIQDPRERPTGPDQATAASLHARFDVPGSDLLSYLRLWEHLHEARRGRSGNQFNKLCRSEFLHVLRIREWQDLYAQLRTASKTLGLRRRTQPADPDEVHRALLAGLLSQVGTRTGDRREYHGARNSRFAIARDSVLSGSSPRWVMAAELVETNRIWARGVARIQPEWIEQAGEHLVKRSYSDAWWDPARGSAMTTERVTLHGLTLVADRTVEVGSVDPDLARRLFIEHALVDGEWDTRHRFLAHNAERVREVEALGARARRDLVAGPEQIAAYYDRHIPDHIVSTRHFDRWWRRRRSRDPHLLDLPLDVLIDPSAGEIDRDDFPDHWPSGSVSLPLTYEFDPSSPTDGVTVELPVSLLPHLDAAEFEWNVPGHRAELVEALVRSLPKTTRRRLVPVPDTVQDLLRRLDPGAGSLTAALRDEVAALTGEAVRRDWFDLDQVPGHLRVSFRVHDDRGDTLAVDKDLEALRHRLHAQVREAI